MARKDDTEIIETVDNWAKEQLEVEREKARMNYEIRVKRLDLIRHILVEWVLPGFMVLVGISLVVALVFGVKSCREDADQARTDAMDKCISEIGPEMCDRVIEYHQRIGDHHIRTEKCRSENEVGWGSTPQAIRDQCEDSFNTWIAPQKNAYLLCQSRLDVKTCDLVE